MAAAKVWFDAERHCLAFATDEFAGINGDWDSGFVDLEALQDVPLGELATAMTAFAEVDSSATRWRLEEFDELTGEEYPAEDVALDVDSGQLTALAIGDVPRHIDEEYENRLSGLLTPLTNRWKAELLGIRDLEGQLAVGVRLHDADRPAGDLIRVAQLARSLMIALRQGPLTPSSARDLLATGNGKVLEGLAEGAWLDVKNQPYALGVGRAGNAAAWELAKDVAAFANAAGGIILIPGRERVEHGNAVIEEVGDIPLDLVRVQSVRDVVAAHTYPVAEGLEVAVTVTSTGRGVFWIYVPEQPEELKPFVVHGALSEGKVVSTHISIPRRVGADTRHAPIAEVHALLVAGRARQLGRSEILEIVRRDQLPWGFRELVECAESVDIQATAGYGVVRFEVRDGPTIESHYGHVPDALLGSEIDRICRLLVPFGLPVVTAQSGQLQPARR